VSIRRYAEGTKVPISKSKAEVDRILRKHGATQMILAFDEKSGTNVVGFTMDDRQYRLFVYEAETERETRRRWRALVIIIKAKLEIAASGDSTVEREFLADAVLPSGETVETWLAPQLEEAYATGKVPGMLALPPGVVTR
jgi:hypothetical protein